jgi:hypothetical protein
MRLGQIKCMLVVSNKVWPKHNNYFPAVLFVYRSSNRLGITFHGAFMLNKDASPLKLITTRLALIDKLTLVNNFFDNV